jgi:hypothetical protein
MCNGSRLNKCRMQWCSGTRARRAHASHVTMTTSCARIAAHARPRGHASARPASQATHAPTLVYACDAETAPHNSIFTLGFHTNYVMLTSLAQTLYLGPASCVSIRRVDWLRSQRVCTDGPMRKRDVTATPAGAGSGATVWTTIETSLCVVSMATDGWLCAQCATVTPPARECLGALRAATATRRGRQSQTRHTHA